MLDDAAASTSVPMAYLYLARSAWRWEHARVWLARAPELIAAITVQIAALEKERR